ncbi:unnamed protein product, partial (macronuclear) [Paramecium tetraurelia]
ELYPSSLTRERLRVWSTGYFDGGKYHLYDLASEQVVGQGQITEDVKYFYQIYPQTLSFLDPKDMKVKLLDLQTHQINESFVFAASNIVTQNSDQLQKEILADKFRIMMLERKQNNVRYLITQDLEKQYSNNSVCHFIIRILPLKYTHETQFDLNPVFEYHYPNITNNDELFNWQVDEETLVIYGQDFEVSQIEILLIKPHLVQKAFYIIHFKIDDAVTLINVTNWIHPHLIALWVNNNDSQMRPTILTVDIRSYYNGKEWLPEPECNSTKVMDTRLEKEQVTFMDIYQFNLSQTYVCQFRLIDINPMLSFINYANVHQLELNDEVKVDDFFHEFPNNRAYLLTYNDLEVKNGIVEFSVIYFSDIRLQQLQIMEKLHLIDQYGINVIEEVVDFQI